MLPQVVPSQLSDDDDSDAGGESDDNSEDYLAAIQQMLKEVEKRKRKSDAKAEERAQANREASFRKAKDAMSKAAAKHSSVYNQAKEDAVKQLHKTCQATFKELAEFTSALDHIEHEITVASKKAKTEQQQMSDDAETFKGTGEQVCDDLSSSLTTLTSQSARIIQAALTQEAPLGNVFKEIDRAVRLIEKGA